MARMYPDPISPQTKSEAERKLYELFREQLNDDYIVFHSVAWQSQDRYGRPRDGETDFVIAHRSQGILLVEVKGGAIGYNPKTGIWTSASPDKEVYTINNPFGQARDSMYVLRSQLSAMLGVPLRQVSIGYAVALPDIAISNSLALDKPREIILDITDLADLASWADGVFAYWRGKETETISAPTAQTVEAATELFGKTWELRPALWGQLLQEQKQLVRLTEQQYLVLDILNRQRRALVCGCAGSGKTMLAAEKATRLARQGFRVLFTCFNKNLAAYLHTQLRPPANLDIIHFHELCHGMAKRAGILPHAPKYDTEFFRYKLPVALMEAAAILDVSYDAVIVDEGQDFETTWWSSLLVLLRDQHDGILYIFFDDNQRLYVSRSAFPILQEPYCLTVNCRNTQSIHHLVTRFYDADVRPIARGPIGRPVELILYDDRKALQAALMAVLQRLTKDEQVPAQEIAVLSPLAEKSEFCTEAASGDGVLTDTWPSPAGRVYCSSVYGFKGLERSVVVLVEMERWHKDLVPLLYVGCSRASNHLVVLLPKDAGAEIREAFAVAQGQKKSL